MRYTFSLRHFLYFVASCGVLLAAMRMGGAIAQVAIIGIGVFATAQLIVAFVGSGARRAFAIGFLVPFCIYLAVHATSAQGQLDPYSDKAFPTTRSFQVLHRALVDRTWIDYQTEAIVPPSDPRVVELMRSGGTTMMTPAGMVTLRERPTRSMFALLAHAALASIVGLAGAIYAVYVRASQNGG
ncbi:MAG: hypothetical protein HKN47_11535 [Pirellulaceae bacterium]|nr:hypothetical protein [Pirellulaceae bacterium]